MKKLLMMVILASAMMLGVADTYKVKVEGKAYVIISETERLPLEEEDEVQSEDVISLSEGAKITFIVNGNKCTIKKVGEFKVEDKVKFLK